MKEIDVSKLEKLPKWAQQEIKNLSRQREVAVNALNEYVDNQTESPFYIDEMECTGERQGPSVKKRYIQGYRMNVIHEKVELKIILREGYIDIGWTGTDHACQDVAFCPSSYQQARITSKENMR